MKNITLLWTPFTGLGLYNGFRGNRWLRNRIKIYKQFVIASLLNQSDQGFALWISWRPEERTNLYVKELDDWLTEHTPWPHVFTYGGLPMYDDKYEDREARLRVTMALQRTLPDLMDICGGVDEVFVLLVPSDDLYHTHTVASVKRTFNETKAKGCGFQKGYICNYHTKEILEYNPKTNPPFFAARYPHNTFFNPQKHLDYIATKVDEGKYKAGTPYPSHEWIPNAFAPYAFFNERGFMVGTHGENISTHFNHPFGGRRIEGEERIQMQKDFGIARVEMLSLPLSLRKWAIRKLPYGWQRKLRYWMGEKLYPMFYKFIRN